MTENDITRRGLITGAGASVGLAAASNTIFPANAASLGNTLQNAFDTFVNQLGAGQFPMPPRADILGNHVPDLQGLSRDNLGIIIQLEDHGKLDGGDSAHRTGVTAFCNSDQDQKLLPLFESDGRMVRHPVQVPWNNWKNCTRDQLIGYTAGCWRAGKLDINLRLLVAHATRTPPFTCQDTENDYPGSTKNPPIGDPLGPDDIMHLRICSGDNSAFMDVTGQFALQLGIELASPDVQDDKNNLILRAIVCGRLNLLVQAVPNYAEALRYYWSGWRQQPRIAEELIWVIKKELERYPTIGIPLLPSNIIALLRGLDLKAELTNFNPLRHAELATKFGEAALKDAANTYVNVMRVSLDEGVAQLNKMGATVDQSAKALAAVGNAPNDIRNALKANGFPDPDISHAVRNAFPGIPHVDRAGVPAVNISAAPHADVGAAHTDVGAVRVNTSTGHVDNRTFGVHTDIGGIHTDRVITPHVDLIVTPHIDVAPKAHIDTPATLHVDTP